MGGAGDRNMVEGCCEALRVAPGAATANTHECQSELKEAAGAINMSNMWCGRKQRYLLCGTGQCVRTSGGGDT